jgi:predicted transcriptional regulator
MSNITLSVDDDVIRRVRKLAVDRRTTLTELVRSYLIKLAQEDALQRELQRGELEEGFRRYGRAIGGRKWTRDELHER